MKESWKAHALAAGDQAMAFALQGAKAIAFFENDGCDAHSETALRACKRGFAGP